VPVLLAVGEEAPNGACQLLSAASVEVFRAGGSNHAERLNSLLAELGRRRMTNVLVEGGGRLLGLLFEQRAIDEVHVFIAPKIAGGEAAPGAIGGAGIERMTDALGLGDITIDELDGDVYVHGRIQSTGY
jgi:diaminohydroxyphosphoribosylaminopyrimidine deaminase/5-amino-6-(5-phosphoribosylamino)uracil reductase